MGGAPGSSAGCRQCRQRRKKCGMELPACLRCTKSGLKCSKPGKVDVYVHRDATNITRVSDRAALRAAFVARANDTGLTTHWRDRPASVEETAPNRPFTFSPINSSMLDSLLNVSSMRSLFASVADEFKPGLEIGIFSGDRISSSVPIYSGLATCIRALIPLASLSVKLPDLGIFGSLVHYIGRFRGRRELVDLAHSSYTAALGDFHHRLNDITSALQSRRQAVDVSSRIFCLCLALQLFELIDQNALGAGFEAHINGIMAILQVTEPASYNARYLRDAFGGLRGMVLGVALRNRRRTLLAQPDWLHLPFQGTEKSPVERLHDLALELPGLLERTDGMSMISSPVRLDKHMVFLASEYVDLKDRLVHWFDGFKAVEGGQVYWIVTSDAENEAFAPDVDPICVPSFPDQSFVLRFPNGPKAGLLCHYWSFQLQLLMGLSEVHQQRLSWSDEMGFDCSTSNIDVGSIDLEASELAQLILHAEPYLSSCLEGRITVQAPVEIVNRYLTKPKSDALSKPPSLPTQMILQGGLQLF